MEFTQRDIEKIIRIKLLERGYDNHAADRQIFNESVEDIAAAVYEKVKPSHRSVEEVRADVYKHERQFPTHGSRCACMEQYIRELRKIFETTPKDNYHVEPGERHRWLAVLRTAVPS